MIQFPKLAAHYHPLTGQPGDALLWEAMGGEIKQVVVWKNQNYGRDQGGFMISLKKSSVSECFVFLSIWMVFVCKLMHQIFVFLYSCSIRSVMQKYLEERDELTFDKIFNQKIGEFS